MCSLALFKLTNMRQFITQFPFNRCLKYASPSSDHLWVSDSVHCTAPERVGHLTLEARWLIPELCCCLVVEWIVGVWLNEEENEAENDWVDSEDGLPVGTQNVEAHIAVRVDVGVVDRRIAVDLGRFVRVAVRDGDAELVLAPLPHAIFLG